MVGIQHSAVELFPELSGYRKTDFLVPVLVFAAGHGDEQTVLTALDDFDSRDGKASVDGC